MVCGTVPERQWQPPGRAARLTSDLRHAGSIGRRSAVTGDALHALASELYPICRSITGDGRARDAAKACALHPARRSTRCRAARRSSTGPCRGSGTSATPGSPTRRGERVVDFRDHNLHVMSYSLPVRAQDVARRAAPASSLRSGASGLDPLPDQLLQGGLGLLPERTEPCEALQDGDYEVVIDSTLGDGCADLWRVLPPRRGSTTRCWSRCMSAIRRSPTTTFPGSRWRRRSRSA